MPNTREKLIELFTHDDCPIFMVFGDNMEGLVDYLIANGVTIGKPLAEYLHPIDAYEGLKAKYLVFKADTGRQVENCFVLRPDKDKAAVEALRAYANATENKTLAEDIYNWVGKGEPVQEWIPASDPPKDDLPVLVTCGRGYRPFVARYDLIWKRWRVSHTLRITHWQPLPGTSNLPRPPKGE